MLPEARVQNRFMTDRAIGLLTVLPLLAGLALTAACSSDPKQGGTTVGLPDTAGGADTADSGPIFRVDSGTADAGGAADTAGQDAGSQDGGTTQADTGTSDAGPTDTGSVCPGGSGCACAVNADCDNGLCIDTPGGQVCATTCVNSCPAGMNCKQVAIGGGDPLSICVPAHGWICDPCHDDKGCQSLGQPLARCVRYGLAGNFCGVSCTNDGDCPGGYACKDAKNVSGTSSKQCVLAGGTASVCPCSPRAVKKGLTTWCGASYPNNAGGDDELICAGLRRCNKVGKEGPTKCKSPAPATEACDGLDNDCDGATDESGCDDNNPCTTDACNGATCVNKPLDGLQCDDNDPCSAGDVCKAGKCTAGTPICTCQSDADCKDDGDLCNGTPKCDKTNVPFTCKLDPKTVIACDSKNDTTCARNTCQAGTGKCHLTAVKDGLPCSDENPCTVNDACAAAVCKPGSNICECKQDADCKDDGDLCNGTRLCDKAKLPWACKTDPKTVVSCSKAADTTCAKAACEPKTGKCALAPVKDGAPCDDGEPCSVSDICKAGKCAAGTSICDCKQDADCKDDGDLCNGTLKCDKAKAPFKCVVDAKTIVVCDNKADTACAKAACAAKTGKCAPKPVVAGAACDDGKPCTVGDKCSGGKCAAGTDICACKVAADCNDDGDLCNGVPLCDTAKVPYTCKLDPKTVVTCDKSGDTACATAKCAAKTGKCGPINEADGKACDDKQPCTVKDACKAGKCGGQPNGCDDKNPCTNDSCEQGQGGAAGGCKHTNNTLKCDDGDACTDGDVCKAGKCASGAKPTCADNKKNGDETDIDCGGSKVVCGAKPCSACKPHKGCIKDSDCTTNVCSAGKCAAASCSDGKLNGDETKVDCGGSCKMCPTLFLMSAGGTTTMAVMAEGGSWKTTELGATTVDAPALSTLGGKQVLGLMRFTKVGDGHDNHLQYTRWDGKAWSKLAIIGKGITTRARPAAIGSAGAAHALFQGMDYKLYYTVITGDKWASVEPVGKVQSYGPQPASVAAVGSAVAMCWSRGKDNNLALRERAAGAWGEELSLAGDPDYGITPAIVAPTADAELAVVYVRKDHLLVSRVRVKGKWATAQTIANAYTKQPPALAALAKGHLLTAFRGLDGKIYTSRRQSGAWTAPAAVGNPAFTTTTSPALSAGIDGHDAELVWVGGDKNIYHTRLKANAWSAAVKVASNAAGVSVLRAP